MYITKFLITILFLFLVACANDYSDIGSFRVVTASSLGCQAKNEFYYIDRDKPNSKPIFLGNCFTPGYITKNFHMPSDPSCFAVSEDGSSMVYFHWPNLCGAIDAAKNKPGGVYRYNSTIGESQLYSDNQVTQLWSSLPIDSHSIRVKYHGSEPSHSGAVCAQTIVISASDGEVAEGEPNKASYKCR